MRFLAEASRVSPGVDSTTLSVLSVRSGLLLRVSCRLVGHPGCLAFDRAAGHPLNDHPVDSVRAHAGRRSAGPRPFHRLCLSADLDFFLCRLPYQSLPFCLLIEKPFRPSRESLARMRPYVLSTFVPVKLYGFPRKCKHPAITRIQKAYTQHKSRTEKAESRKQKAEGRKQKQEARSKKQEAVWTTRCSR